MCYLSDIERNCKIVGLRATEFNAQSDVLESCGDWQPLGNVVRKIVNRLGASTGFARAHRERKHQEKQSTHVTDPIEPLVTLPMDGANDIAHRFSGH
jgi:hypothetical protein